MPSKNQSTGRLRAERDAERKARRFSEARIRQFVETAIDAVVEMDERGIVRNWNARSEALFGWTRDEAIGRSVAELIIPAAYRDAHRAGLRAYLEKGEAVLLGRRVEIEALHKNGHSFPVELTISAFRFDRRVRFSAFIRDIAERLRMEAALREELRISQAMATVNSQLSVTAGTEDLIARLCELTTRVLSCEFSYTMFLDDEDRWIPAHGHDTGEEWDAVRMLDFPAEPLVATLRRQPVVCLTAEMEELPFAWLMRRYDISAILLIGLRRGEEIIGFQTAGHRSPGATFNSHQIRAAGELAKIAGIAIENARLVQELRRANRLKSDFVATMSHELRTPLNVILGYQEMLLDGAFETLTQGQREIVERMGRSARELNELITATLDLSRIDAGRVEVEAEAFDLGDLARELEAEIRPLQLAKPEVEVCWSIAPDVSPLVTDRAKFKVVLKNLVNNAIKFTDAGTVTIGFEESPDGISVSVADTGVGIPEHSLTAIFEPFRQLDPSPTRRHGGVGLGLHIARRLVELLAGEIRAESTVGAGSRFTVEVPVVHPSAVEESEWELERRRRAAMGLA